jgi:hypothetical protein
MTDAALENARERVFAGVSAARREGAARPLKTD